MYVKKQGHQGSPISAVLEMSQSQNNAFIYVSWSTFKEKCSFSLNYFFLMQQGIADIANVSCILPWSTA